MNQNNRRRAFVTVNDINVDVMVDSLIHQNRALDGDTVIVELLEPFKWTSYTSNNVVLGKDSLGKDKLITQIQGKGYTNETAIETRIIDREVLGENGVARDDDEERKAVTKDFMKRKTEEKKIED